MRVITNGNDRQPHSEQRFKRSHCSPKVDNARRWAIRAVATMSSVGPVGRPPRILMVAVGRDNFTLEPTPSQPLVEPLA